MHANIQGLELHSNTKAIGFSDEYPIYPSLLKYLSAIARHFEVLLLDEFTALLDPDSQLNLVPAVQRLVKNCGLTALWVTHPLDELNYCDRAFLLEKCEVLDRGDAPRLKQRLMQIQEV